jgi:hypothetical protein
MRCGVLSCASSISTFTVLAAMRTPITALVTILIWGRCWSPHTLCLYLSLLPRRGLFLPLARYLIDPLTSPFPSSSLSFLQPSILLSPFIHPFLPLYFPPSIHLRLSLPLPRAPYVLGMHFFTPAHIMRLVEVVQCKHTSVKASQAALGVAKRLGKVGVLVRTLACSTCWCRLGGVPQSNCCSVCMCVSNLIL